jgi:glutamate dehydrogenase (NADP+)
MMVDNGIKYVVEGANMPLTAEAIDHIREHRVHYAPGKAANAGGVAVSALEMSQNSVRQYKSFEQIDTRLKNIMKDIHDSAASASDKYNQTDNGYIDYMAGSNIVGFKRVADALCAYGILN